MLAPSVRNTARLWVTRGDGGPRVLGRKKKKPQDNEQTPDSQGLPEHEEGANGEAGGERPHLHNPEEGYADPPHPAAEELAEEAEELEREQPNDMIDTPIEAKLQADLNAVIHDLHLEKASFKSFRQRVDAEKTEIRRYGGFDLAQDLIRVLDYFEMSLNFESTELSEAGRNVIEGVKFTVQELHNVLAKHGVKPTDTSGTFDPNTMEAIERIVDTDDAAGTILETKTVGYMYKDRVLRTAQVVVAGESPAVAKANDDEPQPEELEDGSVKIPVTTDDGVDVKA